MRQPGIHPNSTRMRLHLLFLFIILSLGFNAQVISGGGSTKSPAIDTAGFSYIDYYPDSKVVHILGNYTAADQRDGAWYYFYSDGILQLESHYDRGTRTGRWVSYDGAGRVREVKDFGQALAPDPDARRQHRREVLTEVAFDVGMVVLETFVRVGIAMLLSKK